MKGEVRGKMKKTTMFILLFTCICCIGLGIACDDDSDDDVQNQDSDSNTDNGTDTGSDQGVDSETETHSDTGVDTGVDTGTEATDTDSGTGTEVDTGTDTGEAIWVDGGQGLGSACGCVGNDCSQVDVPIPNGETMVGCDDVPADIPGAERVCFRTYEGEIATNTYFANGYCALTAAKCDGKEMLCSYAEFGSFDEMTSCPAGAVMFSGKMDIVVELSGNELSAVSENKTCAKSCTNDTDCRNGETDPKLSGAATQYACIDKDGVKFCYDPRNLPKEYTAQQF